MLNNDTPQWPGYKLNVYVYCKNTHTMRANIVVDEELMKKAMEASGLKTMKATVEAGHPNYWIP